MSGEWRAGHLFATPSREGEGDVMLLTALAAVAGSWISAESGGTWYKGALIGAVIAAVVVVVVHAGPRKAPQCLSKAQGFGNLVSLPFVKCRA